MEGRMSGQDTAFDGYTDDDDKPYQSPAYYLEDIKANPEVQVEESEWIASSEEMLSNALSRLDGRSRDILEKRWLLDEKSTLHELADEYGISAERVRQLEKNAMKKLKVMMAV